MSSFLVTGGCGFIGSWLARRLVSEGHEVVLYDVNTESRLVDDLRDKVRILRGSITDYERLRQAVRENKPDAIIHYAALLSSAAEREPRKGYEVNIASTWPLFEIAREADVDAVLFASSTAAYGPTKAQNYSEDLYAPPATIYGISKIVGELLGLWFYRTYGIQFAAFRYGSVIGPGRRNGGASSYTTLIIQKPAQGESYTASVDEETRMPIVYVKDAVDATLFVYGKIRTLGDERVFNVTSLTPSPTAGMMAQAVKKYIPEAQIGFNPLDDIMRIVRSWPRDIDITRLLSLGWKPRYTDLNNLVEDFINEVRQRPQLFKI